MSKILKSVIALGAFDGVHLGHQKIIGELIVVAEREKLTYFKEKSNGVWKF